MDKFFSLVLDVSFQAAIAGGIILLVRFLTRKRLSARWHRLLWAILLLKLLIPYGPYCSISAFRAVPEHPTGFVFETVQPQQTTPIVQEAPATSNDVPVPASPSAANIAAAVWAAGAAGLGLWYLWANLHFRRKLCHRLVRGAPIELRKQLQRCRRQMNIKRPIRILVQEEITTPCVYGFFRPTILLTPDTLNLEENQKNHLLLHELSHYKRGDLYILPLLMILQCLHWFNPVIWLCFRAFREDMELAADELVVEVLGPEQALAYGKSLLRVAEQTSLSHIRLSAVGMAEKKSQLETRIRRICMKKKGAGKKIVVTILGCLCICALVVLLLTSGKNQAPAPTEAPTLPPETTAAPTQAPAEAPTETQAEVTQPAVVTIGDAFGFTDGAGQTILIPKLSTLPQDLEAVTLAVGEYGNILTVEYAGFQEGSRADTGRMTPDNFENIGGHLYTVTEGTAAPGETYYMLDPNTFPQELLMPVTKGDHSAAKEALVTTLAEQTGRSVQDSWLLGTIGSDSQVYLVLFAPQGEDLLASIAVQTPEGVLRRDYPASRNSSSAWRVDDNGTMTPDLFEILFAAKADDGLLLGMTWLGSEGETTPLLKQSEGALEELPILFYRYTAIA